MSFFSGVDGATLMAAVRLTFNALGWGFGEIDRLDLPCACGTSSRASSLGVLTSSVSSSELLSRGRPFWLVGDGDFLGATMAPSPNTERGLYFGRPEPVSELRVRTDDREATEPLLSLPEGLALSEGEDWSSLAAASFLSADCLRVWRVMVLASGESSVSFLDGGFSVDARAGGARLTALVRRAAASFFFATFSLSLSFSFESLCITSARALPTEERPKDWRIELRVVGLVRAGAPLADATEADMMTAGGRGQDGYKGDVGM